MRQIETTERNKFVDLTVRSAWRLKSKCVNVEWVIALQGVDDTTDAVTDVDITKGLVATKGRSPGCTCYLK